MLHNICAKLYNFLFVIYRTILYLWHIVHFFYLCHIVIFILLISIITIIFYFLLLFCLITKICNYKSYYKYLIAIMLQMF